VPEQELKEREERDAKNVVGVRRKNGGKTRAPDTIKKKGKRGTEEERVPSVAHSEIS